MNLKALFLFAALAAGAAGCAVTYEDAPSHFSAPSACYWMSNVDSSWQPMPQFDTKKDCFRMDSCSGGEGQSGGGCYKWAAGPDAPGEPW